MAQKVEIDIPGVGRVTADNAASEHTLNELLKVMQGIQKQFKSGTGPGGSAGAGAVGGAAKPAAGAAAQNKVQQQQTQQTGKSSQAFTKLGIATGVAAKGFDKLSTGTGIVTGSFLGLAGSATALINQFANMGNSLTSAAQTFNSIPIVGGLLAGVFGAVAAAAEKQLGSYQALANSGATFGGSMNAMTNAASGAGLTVEQFSKIIAANGQAMVALGGTTEQGAKRFADLGKKMKTSGLGDELLRMGYSTEGVNQGMASYIQVMGSNGRLQNASTAQLAQGSATYMKELDGLAKITGSTREEKQKEMEALAKDAQVEAAMQHLDDKQRQQMLSYITSFPKAQQGAIKDMLATGTITTEEGVKMAAMYPELARQSQAFGRTLAAGGTISKEAMNTAKNSAIAEARERNKNLSSVGKFNKEMGDTYAGGAQLARQSIDGLSKASAEQATTIKNADQAAALEKSKQRLAEFSNAFTNFLAGSGLIEVMMGALETLGAVITAVAIPVFNVFASVLKSVTPFISDTLVPAIQVLGFWISEGVLPILMKLGNIIGTMLNPLMEGTGSVISGVLEPALYGISDFIEDNLEPVMAVLMGAVIGLTAAKVVSTVSAWASSAADMAKTAASVPFIASMIAMAASVWATVAPFLALAAPVLLTVAAIGLLVYGAKKLGVDFKVLSDAASFVGSLIKTVFLQFQKGLFSLLNKIPGMRGDFDEAIKGVDEQLTSEGQKRSQLTDDMGKRMQDNQDKDKADKAAQAKAEREDLRKTNPAEAKKLDDRDKRDAERTKRSEQREKDAIERKKQAELKAVGDKTEAEKKAEEAKKETKEVDMSGPQAMLKSFSDQQNGFLSKKIEAAGGGGGGGKATSAPGKASSGGGGGGGGGAASSSGGGGGGGGGSASGDMSGPKLPAVGDKQPTGASPDSMQADVGDLSKYLKLQPGVNLQGLEPGVQKRLAGMASEYFNTTGQKIQVNTAYRDSKEQAELFKKYGSPRAAPPGRSKHEVGLAFDINSADANKAVGLGLFEKFGFARPVSAEAWHIEAKEARGGSPDNPAAPGKSVKVAGAGGKETSPDTGKPSAKNGGIVKGPMSGFDAELHGAEAVVPLPDGKKIPVTFSNLGKDVLDQLSQQAGFDPASYLNDIQNSVSAGGKSSVSMPDFKSVANSAGSSGSPTQESTDTSPSSTEQSSLGQEDSVSLLSSLNNKMDQLISINSQLANINSDQLRVQKGFSFGDMFKSPV
jgi:hypothetical protein